MPYTIELQSDAWADLKALRKGHQIKILQAIDQHLTHEPARQSKSRIKHMRPGTRPPYRLRVDEFRVYFDVLVEDILVIIYGVIDKEYSLAWLDAFAKKFSEEE